MMFTYILYIILYFCFQTLRSEGQTVEPTAGCTICKSTLSFANPKAKQFEVGTNIPFIPFKVKTSFAGNIPVADSSTIKDASLFFWMFGMDGQNSGDNLVIWMNGGPGCDSTSAVVTENGPFRIETYGEGKTRPNPYSWTKASTIVFLNFPAGVMFTTAKGLNKNEEQVANQFVSFLQNFFDIFTELKSKNLWIVGESYAGFYLPYIFQALKQSGMKMPKGGMLVDPDISSKAVVSDLTAYPFAVEYQKDLKFTEDYLEILKEKAEPCDGVDFAKKYLNFPPQGRLPNFRQDCHTGDRMYDLAFKIDKTFNIYNVKMPDLSNVAPPNSMSRNKFFNQSEVQKYINAPCCQQYIHCVPVFGKGEDIFDDPSLPPDQFPNYQNSILAQMIEESEKFTIMHGDLDGLVLLEGTELALQNLSWGNQQGFSHPAKDPIYNMEGEISGSYVRERKLTFARVSNSGHKIPHDDPSTALAAIMDLLGQRDWTKK